MNPFEFVNSINSASKKSLFDGFNALEDELDPDSPSKSYSSFLVNRSLSNFMDTVFFANEMNQQHHLPPKMQYDFLKNAIKPRKRFSKFAKGIADDNTVKCFMKRYGYSAAKARDAISLLTKEQIEYVVRAMTPQGSKKYK
jgi:hypothetical protein